MAKPVDNASPTATEPDTRPAERPHLGTLLRDLAEWGDAAAVVEHRGVRRFSTTYGELASLARGFAGELARRGISPGERVVLWGQNSAEWIAAFFGCVAAGVLVVPLDAAGSSEFAQRVVQEVSPRLIVADTALLQRAGFAPATQGSDGNADSTPCLALDDLRAHLSAFVAPAELPVLHGETPLQILFTSGTTGAPKGIVHTHRNLLASLLPIEREMRKYRRYERLVHPLRFLHTLPLSHVFGQFMGLWVPPLLGAVVHYESRVTGSRIASLISEEHINVLAAVPRTLELLRTHLLAADPALAETIRTAQGLPIAKRWWLFRRLHRRLGLRFWAALCGGATLPAALEQFWTTMGFALIQGYGLTETAALVTLNHPFKIAQGSLGAPLPGRSLRVNDRGELEVRGEMVSTASWQNGTMVERADPWLPTGDLATLGDDGRVRFLGRTGQRLVTAAGLNVYLQDVEDALTAQPGIGEAIALPIPAGDGAESPGAVVVAHGGVAAAAAAVRGANAQLAPHQQLSRWWLWPELALPRTGSGKVARKRLETWVEERLAETPEQQSAAKEPDDPLVALLLSVGAGPGPLRDEARLAEDWGLDSMGHVALAAALEQQTGLALPEGGRESWTTLGDLRRYVRGTAGDTPAVASAPAALAAEPAEHVPSPAAAAPATPALRPVEPESRHATYRYPRWPGMWPIAWVRTVFVEAVLRPLVWLLGDPQVHRQESPTPLRGPVLLVSNHRTAMDVPLLLYALPRRLRSRTAVAMSGEMLAGWQQSWSTRPMPAEWEAHRRWWGPIAALLLQALLNVFPLPRAVGFRAAFEHAGRALDQGCSVLIFPEGRRGPGGELLPFKAGLGLLAQEAFAPILPMALLLEGSRSKRGEPQVAIGPPLHGISGASPEETVSQVRGAVERLLDGLDPKSR